MTTSKHDLSEKPIQGRKELVERCLAAFGKPDRVNSRELIWTSVSETKPR